MNNEFYSPNKTSAQNKQKEKIEDRLYNIAKTNQMKLIQ